MSNTDEDDLSVRRLIKEDIVTETRRKLKARNKDLLKALDDLLSATVVYDPWGRCSFCGIRKSQPPHRSHCIYNNALKVVVDDQ